MPNTNVVMCTTTKQLLHKYVQYILKNIEPTKTGFTKVSDEGLMIINLSDF